MITCVLALCGPPVTVVYQETRQWGVVSGINTLKDAGIDMEHL